MRIPSAGVWLAVVVVALLAPASAAAQVDLTVRAHGAWAAHDDEMQSSGGIGRSRLHLTSGGGYDLSAEVLMRSRLGVAVGIGRLELDGELDTFTRFGPSPEDERPSFHAEGTYVVKPLTLGLLFHPPIGTSRADLRLGAHAAYVQYDIGIPFLGRRKDELGLAGSVGLDVPLGTGRWAISTEARYLETQYEEQVHDFLGNFDTWVAQLGVSYHFPIR